MELYVNRIANVVTILQLCLTNKKLFEAERFKHLEKDFSSENYMDDEQIEQNITETR